MKKYNMRENIINLENQFRKSTTNKISKRQGQNVYYQKKHKIFPSRRT